MPETRVYIDLSRLCLTPFTTGIQRVAKEIVLRMLRDGSLSVTLLSALPSQTAWRILPQDAFTEYYTDHTGSPFGDAAPQIMTPEDIPSDAVFFDIDSAWNMPMQRGWLFPKLKQRGVTVVSHLYDLIPVTEPQYFHQQTMRQFLSWITAVLQYADHIICNAEATRAALHTLCDTLEMQAPDCTVVPLGADFARKAADDAPEPDELPELPQYRYLLAVGTIEPRKNHRLLLDAVPALAARGVRVVFAGRIGWNMDEFAKEMEKHPENGRNFFFVKAPSDAAVRRLYQNALAVAFPTKNEGFGLPIVEAFLHGTPVLASDIPVLREVGGDMADYFDNTSVDSLTAAVDRLLADDAAYQAKRRAIAAYRPRTWDCAAQEMAAALRRCGSVRGDVPPQTAVSQIAVLTARNDDLLRTLPYLDANMPFITRMLVVCPERNIPALREGWQGRIRPEFCPEEQLLGGAPLPADHTERNFLLRCRMMQKAPLDDVFIMTDDDYRPVVPVQPAFFLKDGRYQAYYCYDLRRWKGTQGDYSAYDRSMFRTRDFLAENGLPALQYSAHQPQIIDRRIYLEMLGAFPGIETQGLDEWSSYFNFGIARHPRMFAAERYCTLTFPGAVTDWEIMYQPQQLIFENYYAESYAADGVFAGLPSDFSAETAAGAGAEKIRRWSAELQKQSAQNAVTAAYRTMFRDRYACLPEFVLQMQEDTPVLRVPPLLYVPAGSVIRLPLLTDDAVRESGLPLVYGIEDSAGRTILPETELHLNDAAAGIGLELILALPVHGFRGILHIRFGEAAANCAVSCIEI
ncbi:MAG TPA: hypothetical protein DCP68_04920 [Ruminococcus sp.]|nr:hypothetical protein [Ruminococcus sp.]